VNLRASEYMERIRPSPSDGELVRAALRGDAGAYGRLVERYERRVHALAAALAGGLDEARDAAQEVFLKAFVSLARLRDPERFGPWLAGVARGVALTRRRAARTRAAHERRAAAERRGTEGLAAEGVRKGEEAEEERSRLLDALWRLPPHLRSVLLLRYMEDVPPSEMRELLGVSESTLRGRLYQGRKRLRRLLERRGP
jgi:RNA polymerase sigma-70 factor (ECF subfamily)